MAALSAPRPELRGVAERAAWVCLGVVLLGVAAFAVPTLLGLMAGVVFHALRIHAGRLPVPLLVAVNLCDIGVLVGVAVASPRAVRAVRARTKGAGSARW